MTTHTKLVIMLFKENGNSGSKVVKEKKCFNLCRLLPQPYFRTVLYCSEVIIILHVNDSIVKSQYHLDVIFFNEI